MKKLERTMPELAARIRNSELFEARLKYSVRDFMIGYTLDLADAEQLQAELHRLNGHALKRPF